jgi:hypothetical protein
MTNSQPEGFFANSVLHVCSSGTDKSIAQDLELPNGKSISSLIYDQENQDEKSEN